MSEAEQAIVLDLSSAMPVDSAFLEILHPATGAATGWVIELAGPAHAKSVALGKELSRERLAKEARLEAQMANGRKVKPEIEDPEERGRRNVGHVVARIIGWSMLGKAGEDGKRPTIGPGPIFSKVAPDPIVFSEKAATDLLLRPDMAWVLGQIAEYLASERAFTQGSAQN
jgi:hypothetical protein